MWSNKVSEEQIYVEWIDDTDRRTVQEYCEVIEEAYITTPKNEKGLRNIILEATVE